MMNMRVNRPSLLVLVRHAQSLRNVAKKRNRFYLDDEARRAVAGVPDHRIPLTEEGYRQAAVTGKVLRERFGTFDVAFHSGYVRTIETAAALLAAYTDDERSEIILRHHLFVRERDAAHAYDMTDAEATAAFPWLQEYWTTCGPFFARPPGGESLAQVCERVHSFLQKLARSMAGRRVLVVTHSGTLWCFRYVLERWTYEEAEERFRTELIRNCSVTSYGLDKTSNRLMLQEAGSVFWE